MELPGECSHGFRVPWRLLAGVAVPLVLINLLYGWIGPMDLRAKAVALDGGWAFVALVLLPLAGFPVSVLHVLAGVRWGIWSGYCLVVTSIFLQLLASYGLVCLFRPLFERRLARVRERIPPGAYGPVSLFTMLLPGVPFFAKNYVLPLIGVPLRTYLLWCFPAHAFRAGVPVIFGDQTTELTVWSSLFFGSYGLLIALACAWLFRRLQGQLAGRLPAAGGPRRTG